MRPLLLCLLCLWPLASRAEEPPLTWAEVVREAFTHNPSLAGSQAAQNAAKARYHASFNGFLPRLSLGQSYGANPASSQSRWNSSANASWTIWSAGQAADIRQTSAALAQARAERQTNSAQARYDLFSAFAQLLYAQESQGVSQRVLDLRRQYAELVSVKYRSGLEYKGNQMQSEADLAQAEADLAQTARDRKSSQVELSRQLERETASEISVVGDWSTLPLAAPKLPDQNPQVTSAQAALDQARARETAALRVWWPTLSAQYSRSRQGEDFWGDHLNWSGGATLSISLFSGGLTAPWYDAAIAAYDRAQKEAALRETQGKVLSSLAQAVSALAQTRDQERVAEKYLAASRQQNDEAALRYTSGLMNFENWQSVVSRWASAEKSALRARRDAALAQAAWARAAGQPLEVP